MKGLLTNGRSDLPLSKAATKENTGPLGQRRLTLSLLAGGLLMGIAPVNAWPLAWVALVPLWSVLHRPQQTVRSVLGGAALWGMAYHGTALSWITGLHPLTWMGMSWLESIAIALFAWLFITLWGAAIGVTWVGLMRGLMRWQGLNGGNRVWVGTALWCAVEWIWSQGPLYWTSLSYTQSPHNLVGLQLGQLSGPITVTAAIVAVNGLLAEAWYGWRIRLPARQYWARHLGGAIALFAAIHLLGLGLYSRPLADRPAEALVVGLIQGNIPTDQKLTAKGIQSSRQVYLDGYEALAAEGVDLVLTPEGAIPQVWNPFLQDRDLLQRAVVKNGVPLVLGTFARQNLAENQGGALTQSLLMLTPTGEIVGRYNKVKLVPLGEYIPLESIIGTLVSRLSPYGDSLVPGKFGQLLETPFGPVAAGICYESAFADLFRQQVHRGGQAIFTASNNDPYSPRQMIQHHAQDVMRAIETDRWEARVTNTGLSGIVDPRGRSHWLSAPNEYLTHLDTVYLRQTQTLYVRWGDWLTPLLLGIAFIRYGQEIVNRDRR